MRTSLLSMSVLLLFGAVQGFFLALVLLGIKKGIRTANRILAGILVVFSIDLVEGFLSATYAFTKAPYLIGVNWPLAFLYGPLIYFYVKALTGSMRYELRWKLFAHFIPTTLLYLYLIPFYLADPAFKVRSWFVENGSLMNYTALADPILFVLIVQIAGYLVLSLRLLAFHSKSVQQNFSTIEAINLKWLRNLIVSFIGLLCVYIFYAVFSQFFGLYKEGEYLFHLITAILIYVLGYRGIQQPELFTAQDRIPALVSNAQNTGSVRHHGSLPIEGDVKEATDHADKYRKSALTEAQTEKITVRLTQIMFEKKPYREMGLTLPMLAQMLEVSPHHISQVINGKMNKSFFDFVNGYRVEDAKQAITAPDADRFSILGIAMDAGFNSKSAFYTAFKKHTGMTPSRFKELAKRSDNVSLPDRQ